MKILIEHVSSRDPEDAIPLRLKIKPRGIVYPSTVLVWVKEFNTLEDLFAWCKYIREQRYNNFGLSEVIISHPNYHYVVDWSSVPEDLNTDICLRIYDSWVE